MRFARLFVLSALTVATSAAQAQSTAAAGSVVVVPLVAETVSYTSEILVRSPTGAALTLNVKFYEANNSTVPGSRTCNQLVVLPNEAKTFALPDLCTLGGGSHFGMLVLEDSASEKTNLFYAYSRVQTPGGNGFSVEGFPIGAFSGATAEVLGLKRQSAAPNYLSNCFVGALSDPVSYQLELRNGSTTGALIGSPLTGTLQPFEQFRYLDVLALAGAAPGDYSNVRAKFTVTGGASALDGATPALVGLCTVQESTFFGADFRIAKSVDALNNGNKRLACVGQSSCGVVSVSQPEQINDVTSKNIYSMIVTQPDYVRCDLIGARAADLQIRLRQWGDPFASSVFPSSPPYSSGGTGATFFYVYTGGRAAVNSGTASRWFIDVAFRTGGNATTPIDYGITCRAGNGMEIPWLRATVANSDFP